MTMVEYLIPCLGDGRTCKFFSGSWDLTPSLGMPVMHCITVIDSDSRSISYKVYHCVGYAGKIIGQRGEQGVQGFPTVSIKLPPNTVP